MSKTRIDRYGEKVLVGNVSVFANKSPILFKDAEIKDIRESYLDLMDPRYENYEEADFEINEDGNSCIMAERDEYLLTFNAFKDLCSLIKVPFAYVGRISRDLASRNVVAMLAERFKESGRAIKVAYMEQDGVRYAVDIFDANARILANEDVFEAIENVQGNVRSARFTEGEVKIDLTTDVEILSPSDNDEKYNFGLSVYNFQGLSHTFNIAHYLFRLVCSNGLISTKGANEWRARNFSVETALNVLGTFVKTADYYKELLSSLNAPLMNFEMLKIVTALKKLGGDVVEGITGLNADSVRLLRREVQENYNPRELVKAGNSRLKIFNAVSELARDVVEPELNRTLQIAAGSLMLTA